MNWYQKIYLNDKPLILTTDKVAYIREHPMAADYSAFSGSDPDNFNHALEQLDRTSVNGAIIEDTVAAKMLSQLHDMYRSIDAAGGVAFNEKDEILMIYRRGKWDLPKGKLDDGENIEECALREVKEETGLQNVSLGEKVCDTYHIYSQYGENLLKRTAWYKMTAPSTDKLKPQKAENIMEARWVRENDLGQLLTKTYEAVKEVLQLAGVSVKL